MFKGVYEGKNAKHQSKRILILGESHYDKDGYNDFTTDSVVQNFYSNPGEKKYQFFHKIAKCFFENVKDIDDEFESFWNNVYFANYVDGLCGIGDSKAKILIKNNKEKYNNELFEFRSVNTQQGKSELVLQKILSIGLCFLSRDPVWVYKKANVNVATAYRFLRLEF